LDIFTSPTILLWFWLLAMHMALVYGLRLAPILAARLFVF